MCGIWGKIWGSLTTDVSKSGQIEPKLFFVTRCPKTKSRKICIFWLHFCSLFFSTSNREPGEAGLVHPVADIWIGQRKYSSVPVRGQSMARFPALPKPQSPVQVQPAHVPQPPGPAPPFICWSTDCRQPCHWTLPSLGLWASLPAPITPTKAFWPHTSSDSVGGEHHDPTWHSTHAEAEQSKGPRHTATAKPQAHPSAAGRHCAAPQQIPRVPAGEPLGWHADTKVSVTIVFGGKRWLKDKCISLHLSTVSSALPGNKFSLVETSELSQWAINEPHDANFIDDGTVFNLLSSGVCLQMLINMSVYVYIWALVRNLKNEVLEGQVCQTQALFFNRFWISISDWSYQSGCKD